MLQIAKISIGLLLLSSLASCGKKDESGGDKGDKKGAAGTSLVAETESEKAWLGWKEDACKCTDFACASASASARIAVEKKYPDTYKEKNAGNIIRAANVCLAKAVESIAKP